MYATKSIQNNAWPILWQRRKKKVAAEATGNMRINEAVYSFSQCVNSKMKSGYCNMLQMQWFFTV